MGTKWAAFVPHVIVTVKMTISVTRFDKMSPLWKNFIFFGYSLRIYFLLGKILIQIGQIVMILDKFSLLLMAQYWNDNLAISSHCRQSVTCTWAPWPRPHLRRRRPRLRPLPDPRLVPIGCSWKFALYKDFCMHVCLVKLGPHFKIPRI